MWEHFLIRRGFRNVIKGGQTTGFQFKITIPYYRGLWVSAAFQGFAVRVDGIVYPKDKIVLEIGNRTFPLTEVDQAAEAFWYFRDPATVLVEKPGGLTPGLHKVECGIGYERSYGTEDRRNKLREAIPPWCRSSLLRSLKFIAFLGGKAAKTKRPWGVGPACRRTVRVYHRGNNDGNAQYLGDPAGPAVSV